jgi:GDP-L-fucose synthase
MDNNARILIAGHRGLIGSALTRLFKAKGYAQLLLPTRAELELTDGKAVDAYFAQHAPEYVVMAAGKVGGIVENQRVPADFLHQNLAIQSNIMRAAHQNNARKLIFFASSCMYPRECPQPMSEDILLTGKPEPTSLAYATAKLAGMQLCLAYNKQYGAQRFLPVIPNSVYGPNDNFDPASGHVLSALINRFHQAKLSSAPSVTLWGSGSPRREFIHADDVAEACLWLLQHPKDIQELPLNIGAGQDYAIRELAEMIAGITGYGGHIEWDSSKPDGAPRKLLDSSRMHALGWKARISFVDGLKDTYRWYLEAQDAKGNAA